MKWLDLAPVWLCLFAILAWNQARLMSLGLSLDHPLTHLLGGLLVGAGLVLIFLAAFEFRSGLRNRAVLLLLYLFPLGFFLIAGALFFPIAWIHGTGVWVGAW